MNQNGHGDHADVDDDGDGDDADGAVDVDDGGNAFDFFSTTYMWKSAKVNRC